VILDGPLEDTPDVLLVRYAQRALDIVERLRGAPWISLDLLRIQSIAPWTLRLGAFAFHVLTSTTAVLQDNNGRRGTEAQSALWNLEKV
jgi:hypothetical protein